MSVSSVLGYLGRGAVYFRAHGLRVTFDRLILSIRNRWWGSNDYYRWIALYDTFTDRDLKAIAAHAASWIDAPLISVVMPVYNTPEPFLRRAIETVMEQLYPHWELCIADDASDAPHVGRVLAEYAGKDPRVKSVRRSANGHISAATNSALGLATGAFIAFMDHDDELAPHALYMVANEIKNNPDAALIYSDHDLIDESGRRSGYYFKSDWDPDLLNAQNYVNHLCVVRRDIVDAVGGLRTGFDGSQDYDLVLRVTELIAAQAIRHIPMILYHWRIFPDSFSNTARPAAADAAMRAVAEHLQRRGTPAEVTPAVGIEIYQRVKYPVPTPAPLVSLIVPTRDQAELLRQCVDGLTRETDYPAIEVIIVDNGSEQPETHAYFQHVNQGNVRVIKYDLPFNYSAINNFAVTQARGSLIGLINNDIKIIHPEWLSEMVSQALRPEIGAVGAKLYYPDDTIQHAGVVTGIGGVAGHMHHGLERHSVGYWADLLLAHDVSCVTGACMVMRKQVFEEVGGLDETELPVAFNDVDLCLRIRAHGYRILWTPSAELYHLESASRGSDEAPDKVARFRRDHDTMTRRWGESLLQDPYHNPNLTLAGCRKDLSFPPRVIKPWCLR